MSVGPQGPKGDKGDKGIGEMGDIGPPGAPGNLPVEVIMFEIPKVPEMTIYFSPRCPRSPRLW